MPTTNSELTQLEPSSLRVQARQAIRTGIITGEFVAGTNYPISYFAARLGVSATPVREALLDLANTGLIEVVRNRGFRIPNLTNHDLDELFELRLLLEVPSVGQLADVRSEEDVKECQSLAAQVQLYADAGDIKGFLQADRAFHMRLLESLGNKRLVEIVMRLRDQTRLFGLSHLAGSEVLTFAVREHEFLLKAIEHGDARKAEDVMRRHLEHTRGAWAGLPEDDDRNQSNGSTPE
jgi:DNA-binding GntR family transcriptional regulator